MLPNTGKLAGCTLFITGASRGIGKAIALKAAKDGANIVIAAKTGVPHHTLPGTIYTAAEEIEAAGGKALPCIVNVREEDQIVDAVDQAVQKFGGIDILVNNASAISLTGTLETPTKKVDLMMSANTRGTYLTSKICLPYLRKSKIGHILNISPPINLNPLWFKNHCAYTISKYGMSMCVLGLSEEFKGEVAVNALWPQTAIYTSAMDMLGGAGVEKQCRKTDILADAAYCILTKPKSFTGNFVIDENLLREEGIKDFDAYAVAPGHPLLPDFFLDVDPDTLAMKMEAQGASPAFKDGKKQDVMKHEGPKSESNEKAKHHVHFAAVNATGPVAETFKIIKGAINDDVVKSTQGVYRFELSGEEAGTWYIDLKNKGGSAGSGEPPGKVDVIMNMSSSDFVKMFSGKLKPTMAFMSGKLTIKGDMALAIKLEKLMGQFNSKL
ncbi:hydroxysteroid dehydrogenase-like protein 2 [Anolis carolinensis]|uniref:Hydroxysteroid dehydrogenase-like protein 2 n=1 Tax=Anolis carolinensis TaxID=28377 RepID=G1KTT6_ANOCA|nr:PREDICTED: hydroxysteroid dehydrogenase-like protein 2 [Anolis carolinensis]|eukprot:XP_003216639.1 PREDICTED: hydroxysteroid dehydrogenase-like protein 2 [Anolis carolinensis]